MAEAKGKTSTVFYHDWLELLEDYSDEEAGQLLKAVLLFDRDGIKTDFKDRGMKTAFKQMVMATSHNRESYDAACKKKADYYKKKANSRLQNTIEHYSVLDDNDNDTESDNESVNDNEADADNDNDYNKQPQPLPELNQDTIFLIKQTWNAQHSTSNIMNISPLGARANNVRLCINNDLEQFLETIRAIDNQAFLVSMREKGKPVTFDWFVKPDNYQKVIEGNYKDSFDEEGEEHGYKFH